MDLIEIKNDVAELDGETIVKIASFEKQIKLLKEQEDKIKTAILAEMEAKGIIKLESDVLSITYVAETTRETLDSKALKEELPDIYDTYIKISKVKPSIRLKVK